MRALCGMSALASWTCSFGMYVSTSLAGTVCYLYVVICTAVSGYMLCTGCLRGGGCVTPVRSMGWACIAANLCNLCLELCLSAVKSCAPSLICKWHKSDAQTIAADGYTPGFKRRRNSLQPVLCSRVIWHAVHQLQVVHSARGACQTNDQEGAERAEPNTRL